MSVIEKIGPFTLHGVGQHRNWIKWQPNTDNLWLQYSILYIAFNEAIVEQVTLQWRSKKGNIKYESTFTKKLWQDFMQSRNLDTAYTEFVMQLLEQVRDQLGWDSKLERCILTNEDDSIAILDELNCAWVRYQLSRDIDDS